MGGTVAGAVGVGDGLGEVVGAAGGVVVAVGGVVVAGGPLSVIPAITPATTATITTATITYRVCL